ncbi:uncharacterized protein LOC131212125 isoform X1 [Anopheles bellator]|uniref:uncharacterized protein LOC131212125 isoform X1 n=2 Tax=Anopheles bellator TaxID=139047 RepID=UPI0026497243|nr:uncharacterized protein LOC131212125 isoform X1 [Anopheles bellator]
MSTNSGLLYPSLVEVCNYHDIYVQQQPAGQEDLDSANTTTTTTTPPCGMAPPPPSSGAAAVPPPSETPAAAATTGSGPRSEGSRRYAPSAPSAGAVHSAHGNEPSTSRRGEPPTYEEAVDIEGPPPSYDSLYGRVREAHKRSQGVLDFVKNIVILVLGTLGCTIILGITIVIPVCMLVFGIIYLYDCPQGEYIPVYLLVGGGFGVLKQLLHLSTRVRSREEQELERLRQTPTQTLINCFMLGWFIIGSFWIYRIYEPNYDPALGKYCNKSLYLFTFWLITSVYITLGVVTVVLCGVSIISLMLHRQT